MGLENKSFKGVYAIIIADGSIRVKVNENTPNAQLRNIKLQDGTEMKKWELVFTEVSGMIKGLAFRDSNYGKVLQVSIKDGDEDIILCLNTEQNFGEDFMKKLPNVNLSLPVKIVPFSFEDDSKKLRKGVTIYQGDEKIKNFFSDAEGKKAVNGFPDTTEEDRKKFDKNDWKVYFITARKFLINYIEENVLPKIGFVNAEAIADAVGGEIIDEVPDSSDEIKVENVPFN